MRPSLFIGRFGGNRGMICWSGDTDMSSVAEPRRSPAAVQLLEELQAGYRAEMGTAAGDVDYPRDVRDVAEMQVMDEFLTKMGRLSHSDSTQALVRIVGTPEYAAAVEARVEALKRKLEVSDGDIWSRYERPDHRRRLIELVLRVESAVRDQGFELP